MKLYSSSAGRPVAKPKDRSARTNGNASPESLPTREQIANLACQLYIESGCQEGRDAENWLRAEQILRGQGAGQTPARPQPENKPVEGSNLR